MTLALLEWEEEEGEGLGPLAPLDAIRPFRELAICCSISAMCCWREWIISSLPSS